MKAGKESMKQKLRQKSIGPEHLRAIKRFGALNVRLRHDWQAARREYPLGIVHPGLGVSPPGLVQLSESWTSLTRPTLRDLESKRVGQIEVVGAFNSIRKISISSSHFDISIDVPFGAKPLDCSVVKSLRVGRV